MILDLMLPVNSVFKVYHNIKFLSAKNFTGFRRILFLIFDCFSELLKEYQYANN